MALSGGQTTASTKEALMHELSIAEGIAEAVESTTAREGITRVTSVRVAVGELAGVDVEALRFAWVSVCATPLLEGAALEVETPAGSAWCLDCAETVPLHRHGDPCPKCGGWHLAANGGHEMRVLDFEGS